jgi:hypothetical protein
MRPSSPIFVVGVTRSGTTLLAAMLGSHPRLDSGPETFLLTHYLGSRHQLFDPRDWPHAATDFVCSLRLRDQPVHLLYGRSREQVADALAARTPGIPALLESLAAEHAAANHKSRWVEKTPRHLAHVDTIRQVWPDAPIVRLVRDPRDVALSLSKVPFGSPSVIVNLCQVVKLDRAGAPFFRRDQRSITIRLEDLVEDPERELRRLCQLLGEQYDPAMIERRGVSDLAAEHEWWKQGAGEPLDPSRLGRWRTDLTPELQAFAALHCHALLDEYHYEGARQPRAQLAVVPLGDRVASEDEGFLVELAQRDTVVVQPAPLTPTALVRSEIVVFWGKPGQLGVRFGTQTPRRLRGLARVVLDLGRRRVRQRPALWVRRRTAWKVRATDRSEKVLARALGLLAREVDQRDVLELVSGNGPEPGSARRRLTSSRSSPAGGVRPADDAPATHPRGRR